MTMQIRIDSFVRSFFRFATRLFRSAFLASFSRYSALACLFDLYATRAFQSENIVSELSL